MGILKTLKNKWERVGKLYQLATALDKSEDYGEAFKGYWRDVLQFLQTEENVEMGDERIRGQIPIGDPREQLAFVKEYFTRHRVASLNYGLNKLEDIVDELGGKLNVLATSVIPIKDNDLDRADNLEKLIDDYKDNAGTLRKNLGHIDKDASDKERERYNTQVKIIKEYEEFKFLLKDYKGLVENILGYRELSSHIKGEDGKPNTQKMAEIFSRYLDGILEEFKADKDKYEDNAPIIATVKALARNPDFLTKYYLEHILMPAKKKLDTATEKYDIKDYVKRNVKVMNTNKQIKFFDNVYAVSKEAELKDREENMDKRLNRLYDIPLRKDLKMAA